MRELVCYGELGALTLRRFRLRQGLHPLFDDRQVEVFDSGVTNTTYPVQVRVSPDQTRAVFSRATSSTGNLFFTWLDTNDPTSYFKTSVTFSGIVWSCACSNTHYAIGGAAPFLYVFDWATHTLVNLSVTGLGTVLGLSFSPDGTQLAVAHNTAPNLRVYNTADFSFVDASVAAGGARQGVAFSKDGTRIATLGGATPYFSVYNSDLSERLFSTTSSGYDTYNWGNIVASKIEPKSFYCWAGHGTSSAQKKAYKFNAENDTTTDIVPSGGVASVYGIVEDAHDGKLYLMHAVGLHNRVISVYDTSTNALAAEQPNYLNLLFRSAVVAMGIVDRDVHTITGTVRDVNNTPAAREVLAYERSSGTLLAKTTSHPSTGNYTLILPDDATVDIQFRIEQGEQLNDLFFARAIPQPVE